VRWRRPLHSNVFRLEKSYRYRDVREGGRNPSFGKELMPSDVPLTSREVTMSMHTHA